MLDGRSVPTTLPEKDVPMNATDLSTVNPLVSLRGTVDGFISSRLMAAYRLDGGHVIHVARVSQDGHRMTWQYVLELDGDVIFEGADFSCLASTTYGEAAVGVLGFLTLRDGDTDDEYFEGYTSEQIAWSDEHAEALAMFGMDPDDDVL
jgi:hypothetical protein